MERKAPEQILAMIEQEEKTKNQGALKIFFGYAAGVGKTYAMLEAAHEEASNGVDVVCGYIEPHARPDTAALIQGLEVVPPHRGSYRDIELAELDVDAVLERSPRLVLVDELAHTNAPFCRHQKRSQDVEELLRAGIDVWTTVNVQHIESLNDLVASITGTVVRERIADELFDGADQVELIDMEPEDLLDRLKAGKIYRNPQAALQNFFVKENLRSLREIALRRLTERMSRRSDEQSDVPVEEHVLIGLSPSPSNPRVIRAASRLAAAFHGRFTALFVERPNFSSLPPEDVSRLEANTKLARSLGANIVTVYGDDVGWQLAEYAKRARASKVVLGRSMTRRRFFSTRPNFAMRLQSLVPYLDIYIIPDQKAVEYVPAARPQRSMEWRHKARDLGLVAGSLILSTVCSGALQSMGHGVIDITMVYLLGVLVPAFFMDNWFYSLIDALLSILAFNFFFVEPLYTLHADAPGAYLTFLVMFVVSLTVVLLTSKARRQARQAAEKAYRTEIMLETSALLQNAPSRAEIFRVTGRQLRKLLDTSILFYDGKNMQHPYLFPRSGREEDLQPYLNGNEMALAAWVYKNNKDAGASTDTLPGAKCLYLTVSIHSRVMGVAAVALEEGSHLSAFAYSLLRALLDSCALALEKDHQQRCRRAVEVSAKQEQLRSNLLRAISHDLRTPLTTIAGNAELLQAGAALEEKQRRQLSRDIAADARWLINIVENLLSVTRLDDGSLKLHMEPEVLGDMMEEAAEHMRPRAGQHKITVSLEDELMLVRADVRLLMQVFVNLLDNALKYTPPDTEICLSARKQNGFAIIEAADDGPGIPLEDKAHVFDLFYTGRHSEGDGRRGMGIGLALCRSIVVAHGGSISVRDNQPHGTIFRIALKLEVADGDE